MKYFRIVMALFCISLVIFFLLTLIGAIPESKYLEKFGYGFMTIITLLLLIFRKKILNK